VGKGRVSTGEVEEVGSGGADDLKTKRERRVYSMKKDPLTKIAG
jgi:hypothetical protein